MITNKDCPECKSKDIIIRRIPPIRDAKLYLCNSCNYKWKVGTRIKLAHDLPQPKPLTEEDMIKIDQESTKMVKSVHKGTEGLDNNFPPGFFHIIIK